MYSFIKYYYLLFIIFNPLQCFKTSELLKKFIVACQVNG